MQLIKKHFMELYSWKRSRCGDETMTFRTENGIISRKGIFGLINMVKASRENKVVE